MYYWLVMFNWLSQEIPIYNKGKGKGKGKAVLLQAWSSPEGSRFHDNGTRWW